MCASETSTTPLTGSARPDAGDGLSRRPPGSVMRLARLGSFHPTRISFVRSLIRRMHREGWSIERDRFDLDADGYGMAVYRAATPFGTFSLVAFSRYLPPENRTDRVIAEEWDASFVLIEGRPDDAMIARLEVTVPLQEAGHYEAGEFVLSRANKSTRLFDYVVDCLTRGQQLASGRLSEIGYLMRTTAVYGNGKFGLADRLKLHEGPVLNRPFQAEFLTVYMIRHFTLDLVDHIAAARSPASAVMLEPLLRRSLGIGNATGLGMAPFLVSHPTLIHRWIWARETAIARVCAVTRASPACIERFRDLLARARAHIDGWRTDDARFAARITVLRREFVDLDAWLDGAGKAVFETDRPWQTLVAWSEENASVEMQELVNSLLLEPYPDLVDELEETMGDPENSALSPSMTVAALKALIETDYGWALDMDFDRPESQHLFWYVSQEKLEPRLGERYNEPGAEKEMRTGVARDVAALFGTLRDTVTADPDMSVAEFLLRHPGLRHIVRRVQTLRVYPYGEIRDNLLDRDCIAIDLLCCKLSFFGACKFDPKSDRWLRVTLFQGAPLVDELPRADADDWAFPAMPS